MNDPRVHPELRHSLVFRQPTVPLKWRWVIKFGRWLIDRSNHENIPDSVDVSNIELGSAGVRLYRPREEGSDAALLFIHGGGFLVGSPKMNDYLCGRVADELKVTVVSADYRLAPENTYPAAQDDCFSVWDWLQKNAGAIGVNPQKVIIAGESAGGGLAASLTQQVCDENDVGPLAQILICPMLDDRTAANKSLDTEKHLVWNNRNNRIGWEYYLGQPAGLPSTPGYSVPARREHLETLPPTWIGVGDVDLFFEEDKQYAESIRAAGVPCDFYEQKQGPHGFHQSVPEAPISQAFYEEIFKYIRKKIGQDNVDQH